MNKKLEKKIIVNGKTIVIKKLVLGNYAEMIGCIKEIPKILGNLKDINDEKVMEKFPQMFRLAFYELIDVLSIASGVSKKELTTEYDLEDTTLLLKTILEVNSLDEIRKNVSGLLSLIQGKKKTIFGWRK